MKFKMCAAAAFAVAAAGSAPAAVVLFSNFDSYALAAGGWTTVTSIDGWTSTTNGIELQNHAAGTPLSGPNLVELDTLANSSMSHTLGRGTYRVDYHYSPRPGVDAASNGIALSIGSVLLDAVAGTGGADTQWSLRSTTFASAGGVLTFAATGRSDSLGGYLDDVTIATVPETATWALLLTGFVAVGVAARRRSPARA